MSDKSNLRKYILIGFMIATGITAGLLWLYVMDQTENLMSFSDFLELVKNKKVTSVTIYENYLKAAIIVNREGENHELVKIYKVKFHENFTKFIDEMRTHNVHITFNNTNQNSFFKIILNMLMQIGMFMLTMYLIRKSMNPDLDDKDLEDSGEGKTPELYEVVGFSNLKDEMLKLLKYWTKIINDNNHTQDFILTILFKGEPGTGKTFLANVLAKTIGGKFLKVDLSSIGSSFMHQTSNNIQKVFDKARAWAKEGHNVIIFFDELDSVLTSRSKGDYGASRHYTEIVNTVLKNISGCRTNYEKKILVVGATNHDQDLDPAFISRVFSSFEFSYPNSKDRYELINFYIKNDFKNTQFPQNLDVLIDLTEGKSNRDLKYLLLNASVQAQYDSKTINEKVKVSMTDLFESLMMSTKGKEYWVSQDQKLSVAMHESGHALLGHYLNYKNFQPLVVKAIGMTLGKHANVGGVTFFGAGKCNPADETELNISLRQNKQTIISMAIVCLGGKIGEMYYFSINKETPDSVSGWSGDLGQISKFFNHMYRFGVDIRELKNIYGNILNTVNFKKLKVTMGNKSRNNYLSINGKENKIMIEESKAFDEEIIINYNKDEILNLLEDISHKDLIGLEIDGYKVPVISFNFNNIVKDFLHTHHSNMDPEKIKFFVENLHLAWFTGNVIIGNKMDLIKELSDHCVNRSITYDSKFFDILNKIIK